MALHLKLFMIYGIACIINEISPEFNPLLVCRDVNDDISVTTFKWNKTMSSREFQDSYCPLRCFNGSLVSLHNIDSKCPRLNCFNCNCQRPLCEYYGICCPDISVPYHPVPGVESTFSQAEMDTFYVSDSAPTSKMLRHVNVNMTTKPFHRKPSKLGCDWKGFLYITSCPSDFTGYLDTVRMCEEDLSASEMTMDYYAWVVDNDTNVVYRNMYCAKCNGAVKLFKGPLRFSCVDYMPMYEINNPDEMLRLALKSQPCCVVKRDLPPDVRTFACDYKQFDTNVVSSCDASFPAHEYDADVIKACADLNENIYRVFSRFTRKYYTNIFCAVCDTNSYPKYSATDTCTCLTDPNQEDYVPFSMLINFGLSSSTEKTRTNLKSVVESINCSKTEWQSPEGGCLPLKCTAGKLLNNGNCISAISEINGLKYSLRLWLNFNHSALGGNLFSENSTMSENSTLSDVRLKLHQKIKEVVENISQEYTINSGCLHDNRSDEWTDRNTNNSFMGLEIICWLDGDIAGSTTMSRDVFELQVIKDLLTMEIEIEIDHENIGFFRSLVITDLYQYCQEIESRSGLICEMNEPLIAIFDNSDKCFVPSTRPIQITGILICPYVSFGPSYHKVTMDKSELIPKITVIVDLNVTTLVLSDWTDLNMLEVDESGILNVCRQVLDSRLRPTRQYRKLLLEVTNETDAVKVAQYVTTLVCLACSMICLILSLATYLRFPVLQTSAGKNNIGLCLSLFLAQAALITAAHSPKPTILCKVIGILTHFLWLWMFSWTFICSFHMFRAFTAKTRNTSASERHERKQFILRIVGSLICPVIIVLSVVVGSLISSDGENIGYGTSACYLDSVLLIGMAMVAPLTAIVLCNMSFFTVTVWTVHKIRKLQSPEGTKKDDLDQIIVYIKLSSITGACWATTIIAEAADSDVFRFVSIFLNGFQGVFIFLSYVCNKRVLNLYMPRATQFKTSTTSTCTRSQTNSTLVARCPSCVQSKEPDLQISQSTDYESHQIQ